MKNMEDYKAFLAQIREATGIDAFSASEDGLASMRVDDAYNVNLQFIEATGRILCFIEMAELPHDAPKALYRDLLIGGLFGKETAGGYFALEPATNTVVYNYFFDLETAAQDVEDFVATLEKMLQLCDLWSERLKRIVESGAEEAQDESIENKFFV